MRKALGASELIITPRGTIYHLDLAPEHLADTVITVGDPGRVAEVSKYFDRIEHKAQYREFISHTGYTGSKRITVVGTGIGPDNVDIVVNELDALANIDFHTRQPKEQLKALSIFRLGTCGSLQADLSVDTVVASTYGIGLDNLLQYYARSISPEDKLLLQAFEEHLGKDASILQPYMAPAAEQLLQHFTSYKQGITITSPGFYGPQGRVLRAPLAFPALMDMLGSFQSKGHRITNFEMETAALYGLGGLLGHRCLSLNTVVADRVGKMFSADVPAATDRMIREALTIIERL